MNPSLEKGNELECAVGLIESFILQKNPNLKNSSFTIEKKKTIIVDEVRHEIDLYVEINLGDDYKSVFIFECKNWEKPIGKNEIIIFSEKIDVSQATKGYFIAKEFTQYAIAQSKKDKRIELLKTTNQLTELIDFPHFHSICTILDTVSIIFNTGDSEGKVETLNVESITYKNVPIDFHKFAEVFGQSVMHEKVNNEPTASLSDDQYLYSSEKIFNLDVNTLLVNNISIKKFKVIVKFTLIVKKPKIISKFDVEKRGRIIEYEKINFQNYNKSLSFIYFTKH